MDTNQNYNNTNEEKRPRLDESTEDEAMKAIVKYGSLTVYELILAVSGCFLASIFSRSCLFFYFYPALIITTIAFILSLSLILFLKKKSPYRAFSIALCLISYVLITQSGTNLCK